LGKALQQGQRTSIGFIKNVHGSHWVAIVIDFSTKAILYGDSLAGQPDIEFTMVMQWWTQYHAGTQFTLSKLAIPLQKDSFSCGILAFNALAHFYMPDKYPLMDIQWVNDERLKIFLEIGRHHLCYRPTLIFPDFSLFFLAF
jgi:hypothetical protein